MSTVSYDSRAVLIDGKRTLMVSGAMHYPRSTPAMWPELMRRSREAGLNTIETYVFWNLHERRRGVLDFSGRLDLRRFCETAQAQGLHVILRIGPYICAETNFGGLPPWLRDEPGMQVRTWNKPFMKEMARWMQLLCEYLRPCFAPGGGPIVLAQVENEYGNIAKYYGDDGQRYCKWAIDLGLSLNLGVPWVMCSGGAPGAIETINESYGHRQIARHFEQHPDQPALWTEAYPSWYDTWGYHRHRRSPEDIAYATARFFAAGGSGINYYMWHGGSNFGRESMYLQTTSYDFAAPLDEYGLETTLSRHLARLHRLLTANADLLLARPAPAPLALGEKQVAYVYGAGKSALAFLCNDAESAAKVRFGGVGFRLAPRSVQIVRAGRKLLDTAGIAAASRVERKMRPVSAALSAFHVWPEPLPQEWPVDLCWLKVADRPVEQLSLTRDETDYCWYSAVLKVARGKTGKGVLTLAGAGDFVAAYIDGKLKETTPTPLKENRTLKDNADFHQTFRLNLTPGTHKLDLLCSALGLIKGDWMLGFQNMVNERKGIWGKVLWNDREVRGPWVMQAGLVGERCRVFCDGGVLVPWQAAGKALKASVAWWRAAFAKPAGSAPLALDLAGMLKGMIWINGRCLGRYWLIEASGRNPISPGAPITTDPAPGPTQRYYHIPADWLTDWNTLVLLDELGGNPARVRLCRRE